MLDIGGRQSMNYDVSNLSVLVIEDHEFTRKLLVSILNALNIRRVQVAADGASGYQMFCHTTVDLIIVDWVMEPVNGPQLVRRVRTDENSPNPYVPIMMVTGRTAFSCVLEARDIGVNEFLAKPISPAQIYDRMVRILESSRSFVKTATFFGPDRRRRKDLDYCGPERRKQTQPEKTAET